MALRAAHGTAKEHGLPGPRIEVMPPDELPRPIPAGEAAIVPAKRGRGGARATSFKAGDSRAAEAGRAGGIARQAHGATALGTVGKGLTDHESFKPYRRKAAALRRFYCAELASMAGGYCGAAPSRMVAAGSLEYAVGQFLMDRGAKTLDSDDWVLAAKINGQGRQHFLAAYELAVRQAQARGKGGDLPDADEIMAAAEARAAARRG